MPKEKILIVDDEKTINNLIRSYMEKEGFQPLTAYTGAEAVTLTRQENPDLIILDVMLPDTDGTAVCMELRKLTNAPILFLSCKSEEMDKIIGLSVGGDDYMTKPFLPGELLARVKAHLRRQKTMGSEGLIRPEKRYVFEGLVIHTGTREILAAGQPVNLTAKEYEILLLLAENPKRVFSPAQIFEKTWKTQFLEQDVRTVQVHISALRRKLERDPSQPKYILAIRSVGYKFNHALLQETEDV